MCHHRADSGGKTVKNVRHHSLDRLHASMIKQKKNRKIFVRRQTTFYSHHRFRWKYPLELHNSRSFHLRTRWPPPTSLLLLPTRFRSASRSLRSRTTPAPSSEKWTPIHNNNMSPWQPTWLMTHSWHALWRSWTTHHLCSDRARPPYRPPSEPHPPQLSPANLQHNPTASNPQQVLPPSGAMTRTPSRVSWPGGQPPTTSKMSTKLSKRYSARYASSYASK